MVTQAREATENGAEVIIDCKVEELYYGTFQSSPRHAHSDHERIDHGFHRPFRLRQEYGAPFAKPDERFDSRFSSSRTCSLSRQRHLRPFDRSGRSPGDTSAWCFNSRTLLP